MDYFIKVFKHRVDAVVSVAIGESSKAEASLAKAEEIVKNEAWLAGWEDVDFHNAQFQRFLVAYPEYQTVAKASFENGKYSRRVDDEPEQWDGEENDDSDWGGSGYALRELAEEHQAFIDGINDQKRGLAKSDNQYSADSYLHYQWEIGFEKSAEDERKSTEN